MKSPEAEDTIRLCYMLVIAILTYGFCHWHYVARYEHSRYVTLFDWMKRYPGQPAFQNEKDERDFAEYIDDTARIRITEKGGRNELRNVSGGSK